MGIASRPIYSYNRAMKKHTTLVGRLLAMVVLFFALLSLPVISSAETQLPTGAFVVRPAKIELSILPGAEQTTMLTLSNGTALPLSVTVSYEDVAPSVQTSPNDQPVTLLGTNGGAYPIKDLFHTSKKSVDILSGQEAQIPITVRIPQDAEAGGRFGSVVLTFKPILTEGKEQNANVAIESRLATLFYVRILGSAKEEGHLVAFGLFNNVKTSGAPSADAPLRFQVAYENTGAVHVNPYGRMTLSPLIGKSKVIIIPPYAVLPGATLMSEVDVRESLSIGYYTAHLELNRGYQDIVDENQVGFWIVPGTEGMILIAIVFVGLVWLVRRSLQLSKHRVS